MKTMLAATLTSAVISSY